MGIFKQRLLEARLRSAEALADEYADKADDFTNRLSEALTRLRVYEPEYVAAQLGEEYVPLTTEDAPTN